MVPRVALVWCTPQSPRTHQLVARTLYAASSATYMPFEKLSETVVLPDCGARLALLGQSHSARPLRVRRRSSQRPDLTCSEECFLLWEHPSFMAKRERSWTTTGQGDSHGR